MNKAVSWNISGVGFDAREAAREAARRQGKSIGEWLHGVIADHAAANGTDARDVANQERVKAVTARLERLGATATRGRAARSEYAIAPEDGDGDDGLSLRNRLRLVGEESASDRRPARASQPNLDAETLLDQAIEALDRRTQRTERRTDDALASFAKLLETTERRREHERTGVATLADKLAEIETKLSDRDHNPIKGALARLEARLEQIGRRSEAESNARLNALAGARPADGSEPMRRLEEKLNAVLEAVAARQAATPAQTSPVALAAAQRQHPAQDQVHKPRTELPLRRRRLGDAIADIAERQRTLDIAGVKFEARRPRVGEVGPRGTALAGYRDDESRVMPAPERPFDFEALRNDIASMAEQLRDLAPRGAVAAMERQITKLETRLDTTRTDDASTAIDSLRSEVQAIGGRIEAIARSVTPVEVTTRLQHQLQEVQDLVVRRPTAGPDVTALETLVRELGRRMEAVQAPGAGQPAIDALQRQVGALASRLESTESGVASLGTLDRSLQDLFAHLEETRGFAETAAARAAHEAVRMAIAEKGFDRPAPRADIAVLKAMQEDADLRTRATLDVVHETLDKVVDRLALVEHGIAESRAARPASREPSQDVERQPADRQPDRAPDLTLGAVEPVFDLRFGATRPERSKRPEASRPAALEVGAAKADYIAAARRAAHAAQTDPAVMAMRRPAPTEGQNGARDGLAAKSRDYVATHKRPVLMALAAVLLVAATMALVQRLPFGSSGPEIADNAPTSQVATYAAPTRTAPRDNAQLGALTPSALPRAMPALAARIPGSDPIVTGSIPSLPAFAAHPGGPAPAAAPAQPTLPAGLTAAAEAGDGAAAFVLATAYAEGRGAPRDFQRAARLYAKAADKGIVPAQYRLGALYEKGLGVAQDKTRAKSLYQQAAEAGNPRAMHNLAVLLADGDGKPDYEGAATWFRKAAQFGVRDSEFNLAILLARGLGVDPSLVQSYQWFAIAAGQGDNDAAQKRDEVGNKLGASELSVAKALAAAFRPRSPDPAATDVAPPPGGWDGASPPSHLNSARSKISSL